VELGLDNNRMVRIAAGLAEGEEVLLTPPLREGEVEPLEEAAAPEEPALDREKLRKRWEGMSPEERAAARERFQGTGSGGGPPSGGSAGR
jgi:hypothetical protein